MNTVTIIGRLTRDAKLTRGPSNDRAFFTLAVDRPNADNGNSGTDFIGTTCFGATARAVSEHIGKGHLVAVQGRLRSNRYDQDGRTIYTLDLIANRVQFLARPNGHSDTDTEPVSAIDEEYGGEPF